MHRIRIVGLTLVAALAISATAVAGASAAAPEYLSCAKKTGGNYTSKECTPGSKVGGTGKYEIEGWEGLKKKGFKGRYHESRIDAYIPASEATPWTGGTVVGLVSCKKGGSTGEITGPKTSKLTIEFGTCTSEGKKCTSAGAPAGTIKTQELEATLVTVGGKPAISVKGKVGLYAAFNCEGLELVMSGSLNGLDTGNTASFEQDVHADLLGQRVGWTGIPVR